MDDRRPGHVALRIGRISESGRIYLITTTTYRRQKLFTDFNLACATAAEFANPRLLGQSKLLAWVLMPDHGHWLVDLGRGDFLPALMARLKSQSSRAANQYRAIGAPVWARAYHDRALRQEDCLITMARYIVANPLRAGIVTNIGDYPFWDAIWL